MPDVSNEIAPAVITPTGVGGIRSVVAGNTTTVNVALLPVVLALVANAVNVFVPTCNGVGCHCTTA